MTPSMQTLRNFSPILLAALAGCKLKGSSTVKDMSLDATSAGVACDYKATARCGNASLWVDCAAVSMKGYVENKTKALALTFGMRDAKGGQMAPMTLQNPPNNLYFYFTAANPQTLLEDPFVMAGLQNAQLNQGQVSGVWATGMLLANGTKIYEDCDMASEVGTLGDASPATATNPPGSVANANAEQTNGDPAALARLSEADKKRFLARQWSNNPFNKLHVTMKGISYDAAFILGFQPTSFDPNGTLTARISSVKDKKNQSLDPSQLLIGLEKYASPVTMKNTGQTTFLSSCCEPGQICAEFSDTGSNATSGPGKYDLLLQMGMTIVPGLQGHAMVCVSRFDTEDQAYTKMGSGYFSVDW